MKKRVATHRRKPASKRQRSNQQPTAATSTVWQLADKLIVRGEAQMGQQALASMNAIAEFAADVFPTDIFTRLGIENLPAHSEWFFALCETRPSMPIGASDLPVWIVNGFVNLMMGNGYPVSSEAAASVTECVEEEPED